uniref:Uncharacterized protein n=1 Tax=Rhizophora mucronata TaxID=61149 RepID=A0A2P2NMQ9_RHIMU
MVITISLIGTTTHNTEIL